MLKVTNGDSLTVYTRVGRSEFTVRDVLESGGLGGGATNPYILFELGTLQTLLEKEEGITEILVSNRGKGEDTLALSEDVADFLRFELTDKGAAQKIFDVLRTETIRDLLFE